MKNDTNIICDYCGGEVSLDEQGSVGVNPRRGWVTVHENNVEKNFCSFACKHRFEYNAVHPEQPHMGPVRMFRFSRFYNWPITPRI